MLPGAAFGNIWHDCMSYPYLAICSQLNATIRCCATAVLVRVIYQAPRSRVRVDTAGEDESEPQARTSTSWPDPPVHGDEGPDINRVVWFEMNATASGLYGTVL